MAACPAPCLLGVVQGKEKAQQALSQGGVHDGVLWVKHACESQPPDACAPLVQEFITLPSFQQHVSRQFPALKRHCLPERVVTESCPVRKSMHVLWGGEENPTLKLPSCKAGSEQGVCQGRVGKGPMEA